MVITKPADVAPKHLPLVISPRRGATAPLRYI
jgi:hypothetical protein